MELGCFPQSFVCEGKLLTSFCVQPCITTPLPPASPPTVFQTAVPISPSGLSRALGLSGLHGPRPCLEELLPHPCTQGAPSDASVVFSASDSQAQPKPTSLGRGDLSAP